MVALCKVGPDESEFRCEWVLAMEQWHSEGWKECEGEWQKGKKEADGRKRIRCVILHWESETRVGTVRGGGAALRYAAAVEC